MCGIAGVFGDGNSDTVSSMLEAIVHRGPDDGSVIRRSQFAIGARRLSILDVANGRQPMCNENGTVWAAQNGEIYNYRQLRPALLARGHRLVTGCDTEVLPHLYEECGIELPTRIDGMFAVAMFDEQSNTGLLARDRTGKKPLYYTLLGDRLYFASEIKSLLAIPGVERRLNIETTYRYLGLKHAPCPLTFFDSIYQLPPAHRLIYQDGRISVHSYWNLSFTSSPEIARASDEDLINLFAEKFERAMERRLMADVPIGFFLSGGIDSSYSAAVATKLSGERIRTFTLTYAAEAANANKLQDRRWARYVAELFNTDHHEETITFDSFADTLPKIIRCFDEPFAGVISGWYLARRIAQHVKVAVSGDGADELLASYRSHRLAGPIASLSEYERTGDIDLIRPFENEVALLRSISKAPGHWRSELDVFSDQTCRELFSRELQAYLPESNSSYWLTLFTNGTAGEPLNAILEAEFRSIFPDQVLAFVDRLSMAHSLEVRTAFLDTEVIEFVASLPARMKIRDGVTKYLLKEAALRYFPTEMVYRPKEGFVMPITQWLVNNLEGYVRDTLTPSRLNSHGVFDVDAVAQLVNRLYDGRPKTYADANKIYSLLVFQEWYDLYAPSVDFGRRSSVGAA